MKRMAYENVLIRHPKKDRGPSGCQELQASCRDYVSSVLTDVHTVQVLLNNALATLCSRGYGAESLVEHRECDLNRAELEASRKRSERVLSDAPQRVQELRFIKDTVNQPASSVDKAEKALDTFQEDVQCLEEKLAE